MILFSSINTLDMKLTYLISCMHQNDASIIKSTGVQSDVVVVNQCNRDSIEEFDFKNKKGKICHAKFICTTERGLSKSRNMAIRYADGDICQICDDDQTVVDNGEEIITKVYEDNPEMGVIAFSLIRLDGDKKYPTRRQKLKFRQILKTNSLQITFRRKVIIEKGIQFDEKMGSGTGNGGGEENMFLFDCCRKGIGLLYSPEIIGTVLPSESQWFKGYDEKFMRNQGWASRRTMGTVLGFFYVIRYGIAHRHLYKNDMTMMCVFKNLLKGYFEKR